MEEVRGETKEVSKKGEDGTIGVGGWGNGGVER